MLCGKKVNLRPVEPSDMDNIMAWINDPEVTRYLLVGLWPISRRNEQEWLDRATLGKDDSNKVLTAETKEGVYLGSVGLHGIDYVSGVAELGIVIGNKEYWGKGYGTDAARTMLKHAFTSVRLRKVVLRVFGSNVRAQRSYAKLGFREVGCFKAQALKQGVFEDEILMEVFADQFEAACASLEL